MTMNNAITIISNFFNNPVYYIYLLVLKPFEYSLNIFSNFQIIALCFLFCSLYLLSNKANKFRKINPLPVRISLSIRLTHYLSIFISIYYILSSFISFLVYTLAYIYNQIDYPVAQESYYPILIGGGVSMAIVFICDTLILNRLIQQKIITPLNRISSQYQNKKSGRKEYNPDVQRKHIGNYDPEKYFKQGSLFHGLNEFKKPVYTDFMASLNGHIGVIGGTGAGKGVLTRLYISQFIRGGLNNVIFDIKPDNYLYDLCVTECKKLNTKMYVIDLDIKKPQLQLFSHLTSDDFETIFKSAMELEPLKQTNARVYAQSTEHALITIAEEIYKQGTTPSQLIQDINEYDTSLLSDNSDLKSILFDLSRYKTFNSSKAPSIKQILDENAVLYIRASNAKENSSTSTVLRLLFQTITNQLIKHNNPSCLFLDEFKFIMTSSFMNQLATVRENKITLVVNFQTFDNFMTSPNVAMRNKAYAGELLDNLHIFALGNSSDTKTVEMIQRQCGLTMYDRAHEQDENELGGGHTTKSTKSYSKYTDYKVTANEISNGDKNTMILLAPSLLKDDFARISIDYIKSNKTNFEISKTFEQDELKVKPKTKVKQIEQAPELNNQDNQNMWQNYENQQNSPN